MHEDCFLNKIKSGLLGNCECATFTIILTVPNFPGCGCNEWPTGRERENVGNLDMSKLDMSRANPFFFFWNPLHKSRYSCMNDTRISRILDSGLPGLTAGTLSGVRWSATPLEESRPSDASLAGSKSSWDPCFSFYFPLILACRRPSSEHAWRFVFVLKLTQHLAN